MSLESKCIIILDRGENTTCTVNLFGATVTSWRVKNEEQIYIGKSAVFDGKEEILGGISIVFPIYGKWSFGPHNGFAKLCLWKLEKPPTKISNSMDIEAIFSLEDNLYTRSMWHFNFKIFYHIILGDRRLHFYITLQNTSKRYTFRCNLALLNHLLTPDIYICKMSGVSKCNYIDYYLDATDNVRKEKNKWLQLCTFLNRIYKTIIHEHTIINSMNEKQLNVIKYNFPETILRNPWMQFPNEDTKFLDEEFFHMLCVQPGNVLKPFTLLPGEMYVAGQTLEIIFPEKDIPVWKWAFCGL